MKDHSLELRAARKKLRNQGFKLIKVDTDRTRGGIVIIVEAYKKGRMSHSDRITHHLASIKIWETRFGDVINFESTIHY